MGSFLKTLQLFMLNNKNVGFKTFFKFKNQLEESKFKELKTLDLPRDYKIAKEKLRSRFNSDSINLLPKIDVSNSKNVIRHKN